MHVCDEKWIEMSQTCKIKCPRKMVFNRFLPSPLQPESKQGSVWFRRFQPYWVSGLQPYRQSSGEPKALAKNHLSFTF